MSRVSRLFSKLLERPYSIICLVGGLTLMFICNHYSPYFPDPIVGRAQAKEPEQKAQRIKDFALPADHRLVNVATQCFSGGTCEPWWLLQSKKDPSFFLYTNGYQEYSFTESK